MINPKLKIDHVHLKVSDLEKSLQFYRSILGFKILRQESTTAFLSSSGDKDSARFLVILSELKDSAVSIFHHKPRVAGLYHYAILLPERRHLAYFLKHIQKNLNPEYYEGMADHADQNQYTYMILILMGLRFIVIEILQNGNGKKIQYIWLLNH